MNKAMVESFARENALCMDYVKYDDMDFSSPEHREWISESEGQYTYNGGVVAFVVNGHYYATPLVDMALEVLKRAGFNSDKGIFVPFNALTGFPGRLGPEGRRRMWASAYYPESKSFDAALKMVYYYQEVQRNHGSYNTWKNLLNRSGALGTNNGKRITLDDVVNDMIARILKNPDDYNRYAAQELGISSELQSQDTNSSRRRR